MADEVASLLVRITADGSQAVGVLQGIEQTVGTLASSNATMMNKIAASGALATKVGTTITKTVGIATVAGLVASAKAAGQLNKELANIGTLSVPTEKLKQYKGQIQDIAVATGKSTSDIAEGTYQVVSAFGDSADTMEKVEINAKAARAGLATTADSIALTSAVTKAYGDTSAGATQKVADLAFKTVELGQTTFPELAQSMQQVTSLSKELGVSQEELFGAYATLTGVTGNAAEVQTQMKAVYTALLKPSENMTKAIRQQGFESGYSMIKTLGFAGTLDALKKATNGSEEEMLGLFNNVRAMPAVMALTGAQYDTFTQKLGKMQEATGAASNAFEVQTEGIAKTGFTLEQAKVKMQVAAQRFGESAAPIIADFAGVVDKAATSIANMSDEERRGMIDTALFVTKFGIGLSVVGKAAGWLTKVSGVINTVRGAVTGAGEAASAAGTAAGNTATEVATLGEVSGHAASSIAGIGTAFGAVAVGAAAAAAPAAISAGIMLAGGKAVEAYYTNLETSGEKAIETAENYAEVSRDAYNMAESAKTVRDYVGQYRELKSLVDSGQGNEGTLSELRATEQWFIDNYGQYISAEEQKNGIRQTTIDLIKQLSEAQAEQARQERNTAREKIYESSINTRNNASEAIDGISATQNTIDKYKSQIDAANKLSADLEVLKNKYDAINKSEGMSYAERSSAIHKLVEDNEDLFDSYKNLTGGDLRLPDLVDDIKNLGSLSQEWSDKLPALEERIGNLKKSVKDYSVALSTLGTAATGEVLDTMGFGSIMDLFQNGNANQINTAIDLLSQNLKNLGFSSTESAAQIAYFKNGFNDLNSAMQAGALDEVVNDFVIRGREIGLTTSEIVSQAALLKNGFQNINEALISGNLNGVINDLGQIGAQSGMTVEQIDAIAHSLGLVPDNKHIEITADGNFEVVDGMTQRLKELETENVHVSVNADGDITILSTATGEVKNLQQDGAVSLAVNADGNIDVLDETGNKLAEIKNDPSATVTVNADAGEAEGQIDNLNNNDVTVNTDADTSAAEGKIDALNNKQVTVPVSGDTSQAQSAISALNGQTISVTVEANVVGMPQATGTQNFPGGLAMVNDQRGIADPRELIVDRGRAFIPEGRDVILPLSKGAKVYTAAQTKRIMAGIPHYADGKDNSEGFISARDEWQHYMRTHAVTTARELEKWVELSEEFAENEKDIADIEEKIFDLRVKLNDEMNKTAEEYIEEHNALNDWDTIGDSAVSAFERVRERNLEEVEAQRMTWAEYSKTMKSLGSSMYNDRIKQSEKWLEHEERYNGMGSDDYLAGIDRMREYTEDYYARGIISHREYVEAKIDLDEMYFDEYKKKVEKSVAESTEYIQRRAYFNNWEENGDTQLEAYERAMKPLYEALEKYGEGYWDEFVSLKSDIDTAFLDSSNNQSFSWLDEQVKYFGMTSEEYAKGLERVRDTNITWHEKFGIGTEQQLHELTTDINHKLWDEVSSAYDTMLKNQQSYITEMRDKFQEQEQALRDSWEVDDRKASIAELTDNVRLWSGAVTERGREQLKQYEEQLKQAKRDEEIFNLQKNNNATLNALKADYKKLEDAKKKVIAQIASTDVKISSIVDSFAKTVDGQATSVVNLLQTLIERVDNIEIKGGDTMNDNRKQTTTNYNTIYPQVGSIALGEWGILR